MRQVIPVIVFLVFIAGGVAVGYFFIPQKLLGGGSLDLLTYVNPSGDYTLTYSSSWYPHETNSFTTVFSKSKELAFVPGTEGYTGEPVFIVATVNVSEIGGAETAEEWINANGLGTENTADFVKKREMVTINGLEMLNTLRDALGIEGDIVDYIYIVDSQHLITLSYFPYEADGENNLDFEAFVRSFVPTTAVSSS